MNGEDLDIKIFGMKNDENEADNFIRVVEAMKRHHANGNSDRAKLLGKRIANLVFNPQIIEDDELHDIISEYCTDEKICYQIKMLLTFGAESTVHVVLDKLSLSSIAVNSLYDELIRLDEDFYDNITNAFTFYYLALRNGDDIPAKIGRHFAKLCGKPNDEKLCEIGSKIYIIIAVLINREIEKVDFTE